MPKKPKPKASKKADCMNAAPAQYTFPNELLSLNKESSFFKSLPQPIVEFEDKIILVNKFFTANLCQALTKSFGNAADNDYKHMEPFVQRGSKDYASRLNDRFQTLDDFVANKILWPYLRKILEKSEYVMENLEFKNAQGLNPQIRCYRYTKGHYFGKHYDESVNIPNTSHITKWTLLIYLSGGPEELLGGDTTFYSSFQKNKVLSVHPERGMALLHKHGDDCLLHEAQKVERGVKWVLRSDVYF
ncbi:hypothetical protein ACO0QE_002023 [Hanseniaspora vineae]